MLSAYSRHFELRKINISYFSFRNFVLEAIRFQSRNEVVLVLPIKSIDCAEVFLEYAANFRDSESSLLQATHRARPSAESQASPQIGTARAEKDRSRMKTS